MTEGWCILILSRQLRLITAQAGGVPPPQTPGEVRGGRSPPQKVGCLGGPKAPPNKKGGLGGEAPKQGLSFKDSDGGRVFAPPTVLNFGKSKFARKNQQLFTNGHFPAPYDPIGKTVTLTFQARSVRTHFRGVVMGSNADFNKNA